MYDVCIMYNVYIYIYIMLINDYNMLVTDAKKNQGTPDWVMGKYTKSYVKKNINPNDGRIHYINSF